jgi:hypothetical protein
VGNRLNHRFQEIALLQCSRPRSRPKNKTETQERTRREVTCARRWLYQQNFNRA